jgi:hypothetical protein
VRLIAAWFNSEGKAQSLVSIEVGFAGEISCKPSWFRWQGRHCAFSPKGGVQIAAFGRHKVKGVVPSKV